jgi:hypothetical protein
VCQANRQRMWNIPSHFIQINLLMLRGPPETPKGLESSLFGFHGLGARGVCGYENYSSIIPLFKPIIAACVRSFAPNLERMHLTRLLTVSSVIES